MRTVISYSEENGRVTKSVRVGGYSPRASGDEPFHKRILDAYKKCEEQGMLKHHCRTAKAKTFVRDLHKRALESGF